MNADKVLIVGAGAIGAFYGALLAKAGAAVAVVCRSDYETVKQHGFQIESRSLGDWQFRPQEVFAAVPVNCDPPDFVLVCTKITADFDPAKLIKQTVGPQTAIVFIQNGVEIEPIYQRAFPGHDIISGLAFICCNRIAPGRIHHLAYGRLTLGDLPGGVSGKTRWLCERFQRAGIECRAEANIVAARWQKCLWNAPFNPLSVLSGGLPTQDLLTTQEPLVRAIMQEIRAIAEACGHPLPNDAIASNIANTATMPPYKTSMLIDYEQDRPMETEVILGNAVRAARREGVACPHLETIYALMQLRELQIAKAAPVRNRSPGQ